MKHIDLVSLITFIVALNGYVLISPSDEPVGFETILSGAAPEEQ